MITVAQARSRLTATYDRSVSRWVAGEYCGFSGTTTASLTLAPPTEKQVLSDPEAVAQWVAGWRRAESSDTGLQISWETRRWANFGTQSLPVRLTLTSGSAVARFVGKLSHWNSAVQRYRDLANSLYSDFPDIPVALERRLSEINELPVADLDRLTAAVAWLVDHPESGMFIRQLPIRGIDTKWLERHRKLVTNLVASINGKNDLGLAELPQLIRVRFLDPKFAPGGVTYLQTDLGSLAELTVAPRAVVVVENYQTLLALPPIKDVIALFGDGYSARVLGQIPWVQATGQVLYWGDLDTDGFNILAMLRAHVPQTQSVLMDTSTIKAYLDLAVPEPKPRRSFAAGLTDSELAAVAALAEHGDIRIEQERIPWEAALNELHWHLAAPE